MQRGAVLAQQAYESKNLSYLTPSDIGVNGSVNIDKILEVSSQEINLKKSSTQQISKVRKNKQKLKFPNVGFSFDETFSDKTFADPDYGQSYIENRKTLAETALEIC